MGRLYISAVNQISGPWLMSHENLESLNNLFNEIDEKLGQALTKSIDTIAKQSMDDDNPNLDFSKRVSRLQKKFSAKNKSATITFEDGSTFEAKDIKEIIHHVNSNSSLKPIELYIRTIHGNHDNEFNLIINSNPSKEEPHFEYRIRCLDYDTQLEIKTSIDKWIRENKPSQLLQVWSNGVAQFVWIASFLSIIISYSSLNSASPNAENYRKELKHEAQKLIDSKDSTLNTDSAVLLLLKLQLDYVPEEVKSETKMIKSTGAKKALIASWIIFLISLIRPQTIIGIGENFKWYKLYIFWWRYLIIGGIGLLFTTLIADSFIQFINW